MRLFRGDQRTATRFNASIFNNPPLVPLDSIGRAEDTIMVELPPDIYFNLRDFRTFMATFHIKCTKTGTPKSVIEEVIYNNDGSLGDADLVRYEEGKNVWLIGRGGVFFNDSLIMIVLPIHPRTLVLGVDLFGINSKMAKYLKEKIVIGTNYHIIKVEVRDTSDWVKRKGVLWNNLDMQGLEETLLCHLTADAFPLL